MPEQSKTIMLIAEYSGWLVAAAVGGWVGLRRVLALNADSRRDATKADAETDVVSMLRGEVTRLHAQNLEQAREIAQLRGIVDQLRQQVALLHGVILRAGLEMPAVKGRETEP